MAQCDDKLHEVCAELMESPRFLGPLQLHGLFDGKRELDYVEPGDDAVAAGLHGVFERR